MSGYDLSKLRVLLVDDHQPMRLVLSAMLQAFGFTDIHEATNGQEGLEMCLKLNPDIAFVDWIMDPMDGLSFTRIVRQGRRGLNPFMPIVLVTGRTDRAHVIEARDAGVTEIVAKPLSIDHLYRRIVALIEQPRPFVRTKHYFGPDRRRRRDAPYQGPRRRDVDTAEGSGA